MNEKLSIEERQILLSIARRAVEAAARGERPPHIPLEALSARLQQPGAAFVTLTRGGELRGCIGALTPQQPLALDVRDHAAAAGTEDFRFPPVRPEELAEIGIEISVLTLPQDLDYETPADLIQRLCPGVDGVTLIDGLRRATFLPQVWEKLPQPELFLAHLCQKMGASYDLWVRKKLRVQTYQVEEFHEGGDGSESAGCLDL
jgi:AmmeMemoRadiSam system protein A